MTVAIDSSSSNAQGFVAGANTFSSHSAAAGTRSWLIFAIGHAATSDIFSTCTVGSETCRKVGSNLKTTNETAVVDCYVLGEAGDTVPTGVQTITVNKPSGNNSTYVIAISLTADDDIEVQDWDITIASDSLANPSVTLSLNGETCFAAIGFHSGRAAPSGITPSSGWTDRGENDFGSAMGAVYTYDTISTTDVTAGWSQGADDATGFAIAVNEVAGTTPQTINVNLITELEVLFAATADPGAVSPNVNLVTELEALFAMAADLATSIGVNLLTEAETLFGPSADPGAISINVNLISELEALFTVAADTGQVINTGLITELEAPFSPSADPGAVSISVGLVTELEALFAASADVGQNINVNLITEAETLFAVGIDSAVSLALGQVTELEALFPLAADAPQTINVNLITELEQLFAAGVDIGENVAVGSITELEALFAAGPVTGPTSININLITEAEELFAVVAVTIEVKGQTIEISKRVRKIELAERIRKIEDLN